MGSTIVSVNVPGFLLLVCSCENPDFFLPRYDIMIK